MPRISRIDTNSIINLMESKLSVSEFREKLKKNTKIGSPKLKLSHFGFVSFSGGNSKIFYGNFDNKVFRLTMNSTLSPTFYIIKGDYKTINGVLNIDYDIQPNSKYNSVWKDFFPVVALVPINFLFFISKNTLPTESYIVFNIAILFMLFYSRWDTKRKRKNLEQKFREVFEIFD